MKEQAPDAAAPRTLYVADLDGTLLRSDSPVSARSADLINAAIDGGLLFTITYGGTVTADPVTGAASAVQLIPPTYR